MAPQTSTTSLPPICSSRYALCGAREDEDVAFLEDTFEGRQAIVGHVGIGAQDAGTGPRQELAQLVGQGGAGVVRFGLERHAEDAHRLALEAAVSPFEGGDDVRGQALR